MSDPADARHRYSGGERCWAMKRNCSLTPRQLMPGHAAAWAVGGPVGTGFLAIAYPLIASLAAIELLVLALARQTRAPDRLVAIEVHGRVAALVGRHLGPALRRLLADELRAALRSHSAWQAGTSLAAAAPPSVSATATAP